MRSWRRRWRGIRCGRRWDASLLFCLSLFPATLVTEMVCTMLYYALDEKQAFSGAMHVLACLCCASLGLHEGKSIDSVY
jgi:hypothetical protein